MRVLKVNQDTITLYSVDDFEVAISNLGEVNTKLKKISNGVGKGVKLDLPAMLDIETSNWYEDVNTHKVYSNSQFKNICRSYRKWLKRRIRYTGSIELELEKFKSHFLKGSNMVCWCLALGYNGGRDCIFFGRTKEELFDLLMMIKDKFNLTITENKKRSLSIYVHNLQFESSYLLPWFKVHSGFIVDKNRHAYYDLDELIYNNVHYDISGFKFVDSQILFNCKVENLPKLMHKYGNKCAKAVGSWDYDKLRHHDTELTDEEMYYQAMDCVTLGYALADKSNDDITTLKMTKQQYTNEILSQKIYNYKDGEYYKTKEYYDYTKKVNKCNKLTLELYTLMKRTYAGGVSTAGRNISKMYGNVLHADEVSEYCSTMRYKFPMGEWVKIKEQTKDKFMWYYNHREDWAMFANVCLTNVRIKRNVYAYPISFDKAMLFSKDYGKDYVPRGESGKPSIVNGRITQSSVIFLSVNDVDMSVIDAYYDYDLYSVSEVWVSKKDYLPKSFVTAWLDLFIDKCNKKKYDGTDDKVIYDDSKEYVSGVYGNLVADLIRPVYYYDNDGYHTISVKDLTREQKYEQLLKNTIHKEKPTGAYAWGVYISSYARRNIYNMILLFGSDFYYTDTDSIFSACNENVIKYYELFNKHVDKEFNLLFEHYNLPKNSHVRQIVDKDGNTRFTGLGYFEQCRPAKYFCSCGSKTYIEQYEDDTIQITVSGLNKSSVDYLAKRYGKSIFKHFADCDIEVPAGYCNKLLHSVIREDIRATIIDYNGVKADIYEKGCTHLDYCAFNLKKSRSYEAKTTEYTINDHK